MESWLYPLTASEFPSFLPPICSRKESPLDPASAPRESKERRRVQEETPEKYLDFLPHLHALVADGLFVRSGLFYVLPKASLKPLEELFRARLITFLVEKGLLPPERAQVLRTWQHSGFNVYRSQRVMTDEREDLERFAQYII